MMINRRQILTACFALPFGAVPVLANVRRSVFAPGGMALGGVDPVSYFMQGAPGMGLTENALMWRGVVWLFETRTSQSIFESDPRYFSPRYGGYCAFSMARGQLSPTKPEAWQIYDGRLYLTSTVEARDRWATDPAQYVAQADAYWPKALREAH